MSGHTTVGDTEGMPMTIPEVIRAAKLRMSPGVWDMVAGAAESEVTLRRNRQVMETLAFQPRILRGVIEPHLATTVLGHQVRSPVLLAPVGTIAHFHPDGARAVASAAGRRGTMSFVGVLATPGFGEVADATTAPLVSQIYVRGDREWLAQLVRTVEEAGYAAICLSVDSTGSARREREIHNRYNRPYASSPNLPAGAGRGLEHQVRFTWKDFDWLRSLTELPIVIKGVINPHDAVLAVEHGADAVYVSNHAGRELDHLPAAMEVLPDVATAVAGRAEILVDGGFLRGTDVIKALALGARAVLIGKLQLWGLVAGGIDGLEHTLEILDDEVRHTLMLLGVSRLDELGPDYVRATMATRDATSYVTRQDSLGVPEM